MAVNNIYIRCITVTVTIEAISRVTVGATLLVFTLRFDSKAQHNDTAQPYAAQPDKQVCTIILQHNHNH